MDITATPMAQLIHDPEGLADEFLKEWCSPQPYVTAHTSGSTGKPKEIRLLKDDMKKSATATCRFFGIDSGSSMLLPLSPSYIAGKMMIVRALISGARLFVERPSSYPAKIDYGTLGLVPIVPAQLDGLLSSPYAGNIRNLLIGGAPLSGEEESKISRAGIKAWASYGMTETCSHVALRDITSGDGIYTMLPGISASADNRGCLVIDAPEFSFRRLATNDSIDLIDEHHFRWIGRYDNVINSGGIKLHPEEIERQLSAIIDAPFYIIGCKSERWGEEAVLYIESMSVDKERLMSLLHQKLDRYSVPKQIITVPRFARTDSGKIKRIIL